MDHKSRSAYELRRFTYTHYTIFSTVPDLDPKELIENFHKSSVSLKRGRGLIKIFSFQNRQVVCRKYVHGGLFRAFTRDLYLSSKRSLNELEVILYLRDEGVPVIRPVCAFVMDEPLRNRLFLVTEYEEDAEDFVEFLRKADRKSRLRAIRYLAYLFGRLAVKGVYHPDLHLRNILVKKTGHILLLDFDRARRRTITEKDAEKMLWRLNRYVQKLTDNRVISVTDFERTLFLRTYMYTTGFDLIEGMRTRAAMKHAISRIGRMVESFFYRDKT